MVEEFVLSARKCTNESFHCNAFSEDTQNTSITNAEIHKQSHNSKGRSNWLIKTSSYGMLRVAREKDAW